MISPTADGNQRGPNGARGATPTWTSWDIWSELNQPQIHVWRATVSHLPDRRGFVPRFSWLGEAWTRGGLHTPRWLQGGADRAGRGEQGSSTYLCSSSSSSLVIIDLYWLPLSFPGLYLKENASSAAGEGEKEEKGDGVRQKAPESDQRHPGACSLQLLTPAATHTPGCLLLSAPEPPENPGSAGDCSREMGFRRPERAACFGSRHTNPTAREARGPALRASQTHPGLSRHANPALISWQHLLNLLSRPAFLFSPPPRPGDLSGDGAPSRAGAGHITQRLP